MAGRFKMPPEGDAFIREHCGQHNDRELAEMVKAYSWGEGMTQERIHGHRQRNKIFVGNDRSRWTKPFPNELLTLEQSEYVMAHYVGTGPKKMAEQLNEIYGTEFTRWQLKSWYANRHLNSGTNGRFQPGQVSPNKGKKQTEYMTPEGLENSKKTRFKKGHKSDNEFPIGALRINSQGYYMIKVQMEGKYNERWKHYHVRLWKEANGPIPKGMCLIFLDGNKLNCSLDNLRLITRQEHVRLNQKHGRYNNKEMTEAALMVTKMQNARIEAQKRMKDK